MIVTDDPQLAAKCRSLRNLCFQPQQRFVHEELGWNLRMTNLQAALGLAQLERLTEFVERKRKMGQYYTELLQDLTYLKLPIAKTLAADNIYWVYGVVLTDDWGDDAQIMMQKLAQLKVGTRPFFYPMHQQPVFQKMGLFAGESYPVAERLAQRGFYLPSGMALTLEQIESVCQRLRSLF